MKTKDEKINNIFAELQQEAQKAPKVEEGSSYYVYRINFIPDFCGRRSMELDIVMRTNFFRTSALSALCEAWENRAIKLFQKVDEFDNPECPSALLLQEMGKIYWEQSGALRLSNQPKTIFKLLFNTFCKYAKFPGAGRF